MAKAKRANHTAGSNDHASAAEHPDQHDLPVHPVNGQNGNGVNGNGVNGNGVNGNARLDDVPEEEAARDEPSTSGGFGTPVRVDEIAVAALALSEDLQAATRGLPESVESRRYRRDLDDAAGTFRSVASELETTAGNLIRMAAHEGRTCEVTWGVCPEHGLSLMDVGAVVTCRVLGCHRETEETVERCHQPVAYRVVDVAGPALLTCAGHAIACRLHLEGAVITLASDSLEVL